MRTALAAFTCMAAFLVVTTTGGATVLEAGLAAASFVLGLAGVAIAASASMSDDRRGLVLLLSVVPVLVAVGFGLLVLALVTTPLD
jgi:hypothetical protein